MWVKNECCGGGSLADNFVFNLGTISLGSTAGPYKTSNVPPSPGKGGWIKAEGYVLEVLNFSWYESNVFSRDLVSPGQVFAPGGGNDHIGRLTLQVTPSPEPSSLLVMLGLGSAGLFFNRRRLRA